MGTLQECVNYCCENAYEINCTDCRIAEVETDCYCEVVEVLAIYNTITDWVDTECDC